jgi:ABC-2 type transport system ATP-binding protein
VSSHLLSEVAQTVQDVIVLSKGRVVAETTLSELAERSSVIRARTTDATRLFAVLLAAGVQVRLVGLEAIEARGADAEVIGMAAARAGLPILELSRYDEDLETLFFDLVHNTKDAAA